VSSPFGPFDPPAEAAADYPCYTGAIIGVDAEARRVVVVPKTCGRWDCPACASYKAKRYAAIIFQARPERHICLTANPTRYTGPREALVAMKDAVRKLVYLIRTGDPDEHGDTRWAPRKIEYALIWDRHKSGWPHAHIATWGDWIPQAEISQLWERLTGAWMCWIVDLVAHPEHKHNFIKYLAQKNHHPDGMQPGERRVSFSNGYHRYTEEQIRKGGLTNAVWFWLSVSPTDILEYLETYCHAVIVPTDDPNAALYQVDSFFFEGPPELIKDSILRWRASKWNANLRKVADQPWNAEVNCSPAL